MKRLVYFISLLIAMSQALPAMAVTEKEMEQARVIATQTYLRYANNGSAYLDNLHPASMAELEGKLKAKEKENIKAFKAIPVPKDYASWDKKKLIDYWTTTAFATPGLEQNSLQAGRSAARKKLEKMTVAAPSAAKPEPTAEKPAETTPAASPEKTDVPEADKPGSYSEAGIDSAAAAAEEERALAEAALLADEEDSPIRKENNHTWIYVAVLCILVAVVVALVVFASNMMKKNANNEEGKHYDSDEAKELARKLKGMSIRAEEAEKQNVQLRKQIESLTAEIEKLRARRTQPNGTQPPIQGIPRPKTAPVSEVKQPVAPTATVAAANPAAQADHSQIRTIYLGRANAKGVFVRADRALNPGNSVFRLDTSDGLAGTFKVVNEASVLEKIMQHPMEMLSAACNCDDITNTEELDRIVTDAAGTAIFEDGRWKVLRKAKIHYE